VAGWHEAQARAATRERRPDLLARGADGAADEEDEEKGDRP
jgi:hypothetical protein